MKKIPDKIIVELISKLEFEIVWKYLTTLKEFVHTIKPNFGPLSKYIRISINKPIYGNRNVETATHITGFYNECHTWPVISFEQFKTEYMDQTVSTVKPNTMPDKVIVTGITQIALFNKIASEISGKNKTAYNNAMRVVFSNTEVFFGDESGYRDSNTYNDYTFLTESKFLELYQNKPISDPNKIVITDVTNCALVNSVIKKAFPKVTSTKLSYVECVIDGNYWGYCSIKGFCAKNSTYNDGTWTFMTQQEFVDKYDSKSYDWMTNIGTVTSATESQEKVVDVVSMMKFKPKTNVTSLLTSFID